jgi:Arc/MetJ-type ribon-helix-helix transcriptional regulator
VAEDPNAPRKSRPTSITLTDQQHADLRLIAARRLSSLSQIVRELVKEGVEREKREEALGDAR